MTRPCRPGGGVALLLLAAVSLPPGRDAAARADAPPPWTAAERHARDAGEALERCHRYLLGWLAQADPRSGLIPRNLRESRDLWNGRDAAADNYPFLVLAAALTDRPLFEGRLRAMLDAEIRLTSRVGRLGDHFRFSTQSFAHDAIDPDRLVFDNAEYVKDGLIPLTEWLGPSPWSDRMVGLIDDLWEGAAVTTPAGPVPTEDFEVAGDLLQAGARLYWFTGDRKYLDQILRLGDRYLLTDRRPDRADAPLRLIDHGCEVVNGLSELYVAARHGAPAKADAYRAPLHAIYDRILEAGRNEHGQLYEWFHPRTGDHSPAIADTWGYVYDGFYTLYLVDGTARYRDAVRHVLANLGPHYTGHRWQGGSADGYADAIEGAINLLNREPIPSAAAWVDAEIRAMWAIQKPDGIIEGWHGDGNFARTSILYALWKSQGARLEPWRADVRPGAVRDGEALCLAVVADAPWSGAILLDRPRHREVLHLPLDYPRINQFPEWFTVESEARYRVIDVATGTTTEATGAALSRGLPIRLDAPGTLRLRIEPAG